ncbi:MAG: SBBP repeat-containing protein [Verrucomicrobia bacterium]|nr:SBBP repeat-containing protein [Verrucomicrobiota bacterium]
MNNYRPRFGLLASIVVPLCASISINMAQADAPTFRWAQKAGGVANDYASRVAIDPDGNTFVVGTTESTNAIIGSFVLTNSGVFIAKFDAAGVAQWVKQIGPRTNLGATQTQRIGTDEAGNSYVTSTFLRFVDFGGTSLTNGGNSGRDVFIAKYDGAGNLVWATQAGGNGVTNTVSDAGFAVDATGNTFITGRYGPTPCYFGTNVLGTNNGYVSSYVAKCDPAGNWVWARDPNGLPSSNFADPAAITVESSYNYYLCGSFQSTTVTFGSFTLTNAGNQDAFVIKCDNEGTVLWARRAGGSDWDGAIDLKLDALGNAYVLGYANANASTLSPITIDGLTVTNAGFFLLKYDASGTTIWARNASDFGPGLIIYPEGTFGIAVDAVGNSYLSGRFFNTLAFDGIILTNVGGSYTNPNGYPSAFVAKYDVSGGALWGKQFGGGKDFSGNYIDVFSGISADAEGNCAVIGYFSLTNAPFDNITLSTSGNDDVFVARIDADPPRLNIILARNTAVISWPTNQPGFQLESATALPAGTNWSPVTNLVGIVGYRNFVTNEVAADAQFFRLQR